MSQNQTISVERAVRQGLRRRLEVANGKCIVSIRSIARRAARDAEIVEKGENPPHSVYKLAERILKELGGEFWGFGSNPSGYKKRRSLQSKIYRFDVDDIEELMQVCPYCGDSRTMQTPHGEICASCGLGGGA
jgi:ribosomal protein S27AE